MARNLVAEKSKDLEEIKSAAVAEPINQEEKIVVMTTEQVTLNNLNVILTKLEDLNSKVLEGFKQVGVKFEDTKAS